MKNLFKLIGIITIVAVMGFGFAACGGDDGGGGGNGDKKEPAVRADFNGKWRNSNNALHQITETEVSLSGYMWYYTLANLTVTPVTNTNDETMADYPNGFKFKGIVTNKYGSISTSTELIYFMHTDKLSISSDGNTGASIYTRVTE